MTWTALLPLKAAGARKTRLSGVLSADQRDALTERLLAHVGDVLRASPAIARIILVAPQPVAGWPDDWIADKGRGLNAELAATRAMLGAVPLMVLHADLSLLEAADVAALAEAGAGGCAIAADRHGRGTNAIALMPGRAFRFAFGPGSLAAHRKQAGAVLVERAGLALDIDTPEDLALAGGFDATFG
jgi:2-phospho-L-lactate guanylyltransferase